MRNYAANRFHTNTFDLLKKGLATMGLCRYLFSPLIGILLKQCTLYLCLPISPYSNLNIKKIYI